MDGMGDFVSFDAAIVAANTDRDWNPSQTDKAGLEKLPTTAPQLINGLPVPLLSLKLITHEQ
ncbi:MAG: hypothetical protein HOH80_00060 [Rhodospirillaceae bacterium]|nr:hypothetical protein [Rhodospirillaceae bacterium]